MSFKIKKCTICGKIDFTTPHGPDGEPICIDCAVDNIDRTIQIHLEKKYPEATPELRDIVAKGFKMNYLEIFEKLKEMRKRRENTKRNLRKNESPSEL